MYNTRAYDDERKKAHQPVVNELNARFAHGSMSEAAPSIHAVQTDIYLEDEALAKQLQAEEDRCFAERLQAEQSDFVFASRLDQEERQKANAFSARPDVPFDFSDESDYESESGYESGYESDSDLDPDTLYLSTITKEQPSALPNATNYYNAESFNHQRNSADNNAAADSNQHNDEEVSLSELGGALFDRFKVKVRKGAEKFAFFVYTHNTFSVLMGLAIASSTSSTYLTNLGVNYESELTREQMAEMMHPFALTFALVAVLFHAIYSVAVREVIYRKAQKGNNSIHLAVNSAAAAVYYAIAIPTLLAVASVYSAIKQGLHSSDLGAFACLLLVVVNFAFIYGTVKLSTMISATVTETVDRMLWNASNNENLQKADVSIKSALLDFINGHGFSKVTEVLEAKVTRLLSNFLHDDVIRLSTAEHVVSSRTEQSDLHRTAGNLVITGCNLAIGISFEESEEKWKANKQATELALC